MNPLLLALLVFAGVTGLVGAVSFVLFKGAGQGRAGDRLDALVGRAQGRGRDSSADLLIRTALQEVGTKNMLERLTPEFFRVSKMFEQADVKIKPSALFGVAIGLGFVGSLI